MINLDCNNIIYIADKIIESKQYLSDLDGLIADGDHGINMAKGFSIAKESIKKTTPPPSFAESSEIVASTLFNDIGGSMGPIYGTIFFALCEMLDRDKVEVVDIYNAFNFAAEELMEISEARKGDKTLIDTLANALDKMSAAIADNRTERETLSSFLNGANYGWQSTKEMQAKFGRASRLGERSRGVLDAGATSCYLIIEAFVTSTMNQLE
ncbi:dihydroxyacetone kinase subunit DhaL [Photobacterium sp. DNB23_23_1]